MGRKRTKFDSAEDNRVFLSVVMYSREKKLYLVLYEKDDKLCKTWEPVRCIPPELVEKYREKCEENNSNATKELERADADVLLDQLGEAVTLVDGHRPVKKTKVDDEQHTEKLHSYGSVHDATNDHNVDHASPSPPPFPQTPPPPPPPLPDLDTCQPVEVPEVETVTLTKDEHTELLSKLPNENQIVIDKDVHEEMKKALLIYRKGTIKLREQRDKSEEKVKKLREELEKATSELKRKSNPVHAPSPSPSPSSSIPTSQENTPCPPPPPPRPVPIVTPRPSNQQTQQTPPQTHQDSQPFTGTPKLINNIPRYAWDFYHFLGISVDADSGVLKRAINNMLRQTHEDKVAHLDLDKNTKEDIKRLTHVLLYMKQNLIDNRWKYDRFLAYLEKRSLVLPHGSLNTDIQALEGIFDDTTFTYTPQPQFIPPRIFLGPRPKRTALVDKYFPGYSFSPPGDFSTSPAPGVRKNPVFFTGATSHSYVHSKAKPYAYKKKGFVPNFNSPHLKKGKSSGIYKIF